MSENFVSASPSVHDDFVTYALTTAVVSSGQKALRFALSRQRISNPQLQTCKCTFRRKKSSVSHAKAACRKVVSKRMQNAQEEATKVAFGILVSFGPRLACGYAQLWKRGTRGEDIEEDCRDEGCGKGNGV